MGPQLRFIVNGIPVFAKGADVIPFDSFPSRVTTADYRRILESARDANMNMIRHWGGGYYESQEFYDICDELGIMVWQDFMFGNDWQPGTYAFKQDIGREAEDQVRRLRNHASLVLWCGNNETELGFNWAPRTNLPADVKFQMWQDYLTEFSGILSRVVTRLESEIPYWPSSPTADYEPLSDKFQSGDTHDWTVWHGRVPFSEYEQHHWRFVSEYGFQSFPEMRTVESFTQPQDQTSIFTPVMLAHQKNNEGNSIIQDYIARDYPKPKDLASFLYVSQVLQAEGIKIGAEHFRRSRPQTMGSIFWQLNAAPTSRQVWSDRDRYLRGQKSQTACKETDGLEHRLFFVVIRFRHVTFFAFDVLVSEGKDVKALPLRDRKDLLKSILNPSDHVQLAAHFGGPLSRFLKGVKQIGGEGVVAKRLDSRYEPGRRSGSWSKMRINIGQEFVIGGFTPGSNGIDALVVGYHEGRKLIYAVRVRAGLVPASRRELYENLKPLIVQTCPFVNLPEATPGRWGQGLTAAKMKECIWVLCRMRHSTHNVEHPTMPHAFGTLIGLLAILWVWS